MERIITIMKIMYFIAQKGLSISSYEDMCAFALTMKMANMPKSLEYSSQTSRYVAIEYLNAISTYLTEMQVKSACFDLQKLIIIATDGACAMIGSEIGMISFLKKDCPSLIAIHCIAHREVLAKADASKGFADLLNLEKLANKIYSWINNSSKRNKELMELLELMELDANRVLQVHSIRWLSRGQVMIRLVSLMPAILTLWKKDKMQDWYMKGCNFVTLFCLHLLADVLKVVNALNQKLQEDIIDLTSIGTAIDITIRQLYRTFLQRCIMMGKNYVQAILDGLNSRFVDLPLLNASNFFSQVHYVEDVMIREQNVKVWLERLLQHLLDFQELSKHALYTIDKKGREKELYSFVDNLFMNCEGFSMKEAWRYFSCMKDWHASFPNLMKLWQEILVIPTSIVACERGFSKQNLIKSDRRSRLTVNTLDHLIRVSTIGSNIDEVDWNRVFELWKESKSRRMYDL
ncbi:hypothetical protein KP509_03G082600 [Ceratopteris richardii]|uniref:HAT C-terminal dimerisation domain-containing protein n=1 Tax=Ceratopteris richardii TaxID=49495 RepID=A0A8T2VD11_CERRI|nr:hypothetical protein KP509_03G082600 [Ceratopteris richardii]